MGYDFAAPTLKHVDQRSAMGGDVLCTALCLAVCCAITCLVGQGRM